VSCNFFVVTNRVSATVKLSTVKLSCFLESHAKHRLVRGRRPAFCPGDVLDAFGMEAQHPDVFAENLFDLDPACVVAAAQRQRQQLKSPPMGVEHHLDVMRRPAIRCASAIPIPNRAVVATFLTHGQVRCPAGGRFGRPIVRSSAGNPEPPVIRNRLGSSRASH
jgi:hypothetical protein